MQARSLAAFDLIIGPAKCIYVYMYICMYVCMYVCM